MIRFFLLLFALPLAAQQYQLGTSSDPCVGGTAFKTQDGNTLRYGDFTCTFPVASDGGYTVRLDFVEPCWFPGSCSALVTRAGQRVQNTFVQDAPAVWQYDIATAGLPFSTRTVLSYSSNGKIIVRVQTVTRAGVLSRVTIGPFAVVQMAARKCLGTGPGWDCQGIELWALSTTGGTTQYYTAFAATPEVMALPACPATTACWQLMTLAPDGSLIQADE